MRTGAVTAIVSIVSLVMQAALATAAPTDAQRCRVAKLAAVASGTSAGLRCVIQTVRGGAPNVDPACLAGIDAKLARAFARAETVAPCPPALDDARAALQAFVGSQAATVLATPTPVPTATPQPTASPIPGCGNGITEAGENCDGGPYCDASCNFPFPKACCEFGPVCTVIPDIPTADQCFLAGGTPRLGTICGGGDPNCVPGEFCAGPCAPETFPPTAFCCEGSGCGQSTFSDTESLSWLLMQCGLEGVIRGACIDGACVPGG